MSGSSNYCRQVSTSQTVLLTGATGHLGSLAAAALAADRSVRLILLTRGRHEPALLTARIASEAALMDGASDAQLLDRIVVVPMSDVFTSSAVVKAVQRYQISEIIHCAGCMNYWNKEKLEAGNVELTQELLKAGQSLGVKRFVYLSTAFCSGFLPGVVEEQLHKSPGHDPTPYTSSKRKAEISIAESGLPYLIVRPSIVIGDSRDGRYTGKLSGLYQFLWAIQRYLFGRRAVVHIVAPEIPLQVIHQDAFQAAFLNAYKRLPDNSVAHLVSREETLPTARQIWDGIVSRYLPDCKREYYDHYSAIPLEKCDTRMRQFLLAVQTNTEIYGHKWSFEDRSIHYLNSLGAKIANASLDTVTRCQDWFFSTMQPAGTPASYRANVVSHSRRSNGTQRILNCNHGD